MKSGGGGGQGEEPIYFFGNWAEESAESLVVSAAELEELE